MSKRKHAPAMYPAPAPVKIPARRITGIDRKTKTLTLEGEVPPELAAMAAAEIQRVDLIGRLRRYKATLLARIEPHCGDRPTHISRAKWKDIAQRWSLISALTDDAPGEARDALIALHVLSRLDAALIAIRTLTPEIKVAVCAAIDLGQLLQRSQTQMDFAEAVDVGQRNARSRSVANRAKREAKQQQSDLAEAEFRRRMQNSPPRMKTATLRNMAAVKDHDGKPMYGSEATLKRYATSWKSLTPPE